MQPIMLTELLKSYHHEQIENHKKLVHMRRLELHDLPFVDDDGRPVTVQSREALATRIARWLGRLRPARVG